MNWKQPMLALIQTINAAPWKTLRPRMCGRPQKCMMRIYRDTRFSSDKRPYKGHIAAWWARDGLEKDIRRRVLHAYLPG